MKLSNLSLVDLKKKGKKNSINRKISLKDKSKKQKGGNIEVLNRQLLLILLNCTEEELLNKEVIYLFFKDEIRINYKIDKDAFIGLHKLEVLEISLYKIVEIEKGSFKDLVNLQILRLTGSGLTEIEENTFNDLQNLEELYLNSNPLIKLENNTFNGLNNLKLLDLESTEITTIEEESFSKLSELRVLRFNYSIIKDFFSMKNLYNLKELDLSYSSYLYKIEKDTFKGLDQLVSLNLLSCNIHIIEDYSFQILENLKILNLSNNNLISLSKNTFVGLYNLKRLDLSDSIGTFLDEKSLIKLFSINNINSLENININAMRKINSRELLLIKSRLRRDFPLDKFIDANLKLKEFLIKKNNNNTVKEDAEFFFMKVGYILEDFFKLVFLPKTYNFDYNNVINDINIFFNINNKKVVIKNMDNNNNKKNLILKDEKMYTLKKKVYNKFKKESVMIQTLNSNNNISNNKIIFIPNISENDMIFIEKYLVNNKYFDEEDLDIHVLLKLLNAFNYLDIPNIINTIFFKILFQLPLYSNVDFKKVFFRKATKIILKEYS